MQRSRKLLILVLALSPWRSSAQRSSRSDQRPANTITDSFRSVSALFAGRLIQAFDSIPEMQFRFSPTPAQQSIGYIAQHLEAANYDLCSIFSGEKLPARASSGLTDSVKAHWPKDTLTARLKASFEFCATALARVDDSKLADGIPSGAPNSGVVTDRARFLVLYSTDLAEHYSQISSYMRVMGLVPPSALPPIARNAITLPVETLSRVVGVYDVESGHLLGSPPFRLHVMLRDGVLILKPDGQPEIRLWPENENRFFFKEIGALVTFTRDEAGVVNGLMLLNNGESRAGAKLP
jgi:uncharacterized damage-inducible protein DinB